MRKPKKKLNPIQKYAKKHPFSAYSEKFLEAFRSDLGMSRKGIVKAAKFASMGKLDTRNYSKT